MRCVRLGRTPLTVSELCFGTLTMSPMQANLAPERGARLLEYAYERGVRMLDTAELYDNYPHIRLALKSCPEYVVSTKSYCYDEPTAKAAFEGALRALGRDFIDVFMLHEQESVYTLRGHEKALNYLNRMKREGYLRATGISTHRVAASRSAPLFGGIDVLHPILNERGLGVSDGTREEMEEAVKRAYDMGLGVLAMKPLGGGHMIASRKSALRYALDKGIAHAVAVGMQSEDEIDENVALIEGKPIDEARSRRLDAKTRRLLIQDWCEGCGRCVARCGQGALAVVDGKARADDEKCVRCGYCATVCPQFCIKVV